MAGTSTGMVRMKSFPFDSKADGYDADGYPIYDRAIGAEPLRAVFEKFFTNGVFPSPGDCFEISKGTTGLSVTIKPGVAIINGAMGGIADDDPYTVTLDTAGPQGNTAYAIMLRFDNRDEYRSLYFNVVKGDASSTPTPPEPDHETPGVYELRLGYVTVPSGQNTMANATVTNEKGTSVCPFAAPFEDIDVESIVLDFRAKAQEELSSFQTDLSGYEYNAQQLVQEMVGKLNSYQGLLDSVLDETTAGYLQEQITTLQSQISNIDLSQSVDETTIGYSTIPGGTSPKLHVIDGSIGEEQLAFGFDEEGGVASYDSILSLEKSITLVSGDLASVIFDLHVNELSQLDLDTIAIFEFPGDVKAYQGQYDASNKKYYAAAGTGE